MSDQGLKFHVSDGIAYLVLDAPPKNELNISLFQELFRLQREVFPTLDVKGMIVHGLGRHFSSGADVGELKSLLADGNDRLDHGFLHDNAENFLALESLSFPVVAAIRGCCYGAGLELALACHYRIASPLAVLALPETDFGLMPGCGGTIRLPELVPLSKAIELILTGRSMLADEALEIGLVDLVVERKELLNTAVDFILRSDSASRPCRTEVGQ